MTSYYRDKFVVITGGSEGIGRAVAQKLLAAEAHVLIVSRDPEKQQAALNYLKTFKKNPQQRLDVLPLDVTNGAEVERQLQKVCERYGVPDFLVNNAGYTIPAYLENLTSQMIHDLMETNFFGTVYTCQALLPYFYKRRSGHIINVSSVAGLIGVFGYTAYCATKYAVTGFSEALRREGAPYGVRVTVLCPPNTRTPGLEKENRIKPAEVLKAEETVKTATPEQVAQALLEKLPKNPRFIIPTWDSRVAWRIDQLWPSLMDRLLKRPNPV
jgi:3-dehydrosphinganine reductase